MLLKEESVCMSSTIMLHSKSIHYKMALNKHKVQNLNYPSCHFSFPLFMQSQGSVSFPKERNTKIYPEPLIIIIIIIIIYLSCSWATCWPVTVSRIQKPLEWSTMIPSARWGVVFHYPG